MKYLIYLLLIIIVCGLMVGLSPTIEIFGQMPQLLILLAFIWSLNKNSRDFFFVGLICGLFLDFYSGSPIGVFSLPLLMLCLVSHLFIENFLALEVSPKILALLLLVAQLLFELFYFACSWLLLKFHVPVQMPSLPGLARSFVVTLLYNLVFLYPIFLLVENTRALVRHYFEQEYKIR